MGDDALHKMLLFIYTGTVKDLEWETAPQLYYAADKYGITKLKNKCSNFFKHRLDISTVCDILVLADKHQDHALKSIAHDFINKNVNKVMISDIWKNLMKDNSSLTSETMHLIMLKIFKCGHSQEKEQK